jgi:hypothetical protein
MVNKPKRIIDINGQIIVSPQHYHSALQCGHNMIDLMDKENVDRSDMLVAINDLHRELTFHCTFLPRRDK